jgi:hypothetical protein
MTYRQTLKIEALENRHRGLQAQLEALTRHTHLTPREEMAARELKKKKLNAKDRLIALRRMLGT